MNGNFTVRFAESGDKDLILSLIRELAEYEKLSHEVRVTAGLLEKNLFTERRSAEVVLACENGQPVGFAVFFHNFSTFEGKPGLFLEDLFIRPAYRGRGYGKALMLFLARLAVERDCARLEWSVLDWNKPALDFYRSLGAVPMDEWTVQR